MTFSSVGVVGAGLIGGSIALRLHELGAPVVLSDPDPDTLDAARAVGLDVGDAAGCDLVVLATPLDALEGVMGTVGPAGVVVDVGSVKAAPASAAARAGLAGRYVGCHPMAGTELSGFAHAAADLLTGATWAVTWPDPAAAHLLAPVVAWVAETFDATVVVLDAAEHDASVALVSHAPHVLANALLGVLEGADGAPAARHLAAGSFRDGTRVAGRNAARTYNMLAENAAATSAVLDELIDVLTRYRRGLDVPDDGTLRALLDDVAHGAPSVREPAVVWAPCPDLPALLDARAPSRSAVLLRATPTGWESATPK